MSEATTTAGVDVGSSAVKVALVRSVGGDDGEILATVVQRIRRRELAEVVGAAFREALGAAGASLAELGYVATTGEADTVDFRTGHFYSITTHARGAVFLRPSARAALDVGALHARAVRMDNRGKVLAHRMTSQCASGTGQFVENIARYLGVTVEDVGELSQTATNPELVSGICAVLAETDVINMVSRGIATADVLKGIHISIATRLLQLTRAIGSSGEVLVTGGLSGDTGLLAVLASLAELGPKRRSVMPQATVSFVTHPLALHAGAIGAALLGAYRQKQLYEAGRLKELAGTPTTA